MSHGGFEQNQYSRYLGRSFGACQRDEDYWGPIGPVYNCRATHAVIWRQCVLNSVELEDQIAFIDVPSDYHFSLELVHRVVDAYLKRKIESLLMRRRRVLGRPTCRI